MVRALRATVFCMMTGLSFGYLLFRLHRLALGSRVTERGKEGLPGGQNNQRPIHDRVGSKPCPGALWLLWQLWLVAWCWLVMLGFRPGSNNPREAAAPEPDPCASLTVAAAYPRQQITRIRGGGK